MKEVVPHGFEPWSGGPEPPMMDRYTKGLAGPRINLLISIRCIDSKKTIGVS